MKCGERWIYGVILAGLVALAMVPVALTYVGGPGMAGLTPAWLGVFAGFVAMALMCVQFASSGRFRGPGSRVGLGRMLIFHRTLGIAALVLVLAHPLLLFAADSAYLAFLDPRVNLPRAAALWAVLAASLGLAAGPVLRRRFGIPYEWWRLSHSVLAALVVFIGIVHILMVGGLAGGGWRRAMWVALAVGALALLAEVRLLRPWRLRRRPWVLAGLREEHERTWTLVFEPVGHAGLEFASGQHVWLTLDAPPWSLRQHPFTIASTDTRPERIELTIKALGDFTSTLGSFPPGTRAFLDGPHGLSWLRESGTGPLVMIGGGIGITPFAGALRTMKARGIRRDFVLFQGAGSPGKATFLNELAELAAALGGRHVPVMMDPPDGWQGERGLIDAPLLSRHLDAAWLGGARFVVCGPPAMLVAVRATLRGLGIPRRHLLLERFDML